LIRPSGTICWGMWEEGIVSGSSAPKRCATEMASVPFAEEGRHRKPARLVVPAGNEASWVVGRRGESTRMDRPE